MLSKDLRYFAATAMGGGLYFQGIPEAGAWDRSNLVYWTLAQVELGYHPLAGDRKIETVEELEAVVGVSAKGLPAIKLWVREGLEKAARDIWVRSTQ